MAQRPDLYICADQGAGYDFHMSPQRQDSFRAPLMDRAAGSNSSYATDRSAQSYALTPTSSYAGSPASEDGLTFPQTSSGFRRNSLLSLPSPTSPALPRATAAPPTSTQQLGESMSLDEINSLPLFNIEKDGDPRIRPETYYIFIVNKKEAYYELPPGYLVTPKFPRRKEAKSGKNVHVCKVPLCKAKPFTRHYDLERHYSTIHGKADVYCDYPKCPHKEPFRKDHGREHFREYHMEDLPKRNNPSGGGFLSKRYVNTAWWRCTKCLNRVNVKLDGYYCHNCKSSCEDSRIKMREKLIMEGKVSQEEEEKVSQEDTFANFSSCGTCQSGWVLTEYDDWESCPTCQPGVTLTGNR